MHASCTLPNFQMNSNYGSANFKNVPPMDFPIHIDTFSMELTILHLKGLLGEISINSADPDKMPPYAAFHIGLHCLMCLPKYQSICCQYPE